MPLLDINSLKLFKDRIIVIDMEFGEQRTKSGIILKDDDGTSRGVRARWAKVAKIGPEQKELQVGDYVLIAHGRWTRATKILVNGEEKKMQMIDYPNGLLMISKNKPLELELVGL